MSHITEHRRRISEEILDTTGLSWSSMEAGRDPIAGEKLDSNGASVNASPAFRRDGRGETAPEAPITKEPAAPRDVPFRAGVQVRRQSADTEVNLSNQKLNDEDLAAILTVMREGKVKSLQLSNNNLGDAAAKGIAEALETNTSLTQLTLHNNSIGSDGGFAFAKALAYNETLVSLYLSANKLGADAEEAIVEQNARRTRPMAGLGGLVLGGLVPLTTPSGMMRSPRVSKEL